MAGTFIEQGWSYLINTYNPVVVNFVTIVTVHEFFYIGLCLPFLLLDFIPFFQKYKIQKGRINTLKDYWQCFKLIVWTHAFQLPFITMFHFVSKMIGMRHNEELEPVWHYWLHRALHIPFFYKHIHKIHHEYQAPFSLTGEYAHPIETFLLGFGTLLGPFILAKHVVTVYIWVAFRLVQVVEAHSGYALPFSPSTWGLPFLGGAEFHDMHHKAFNGNYSSFFSIWDTICGTTIKPKKAMAREESPAKKEGAHTISTGRSGTEAEPKAAHFSTPTLNSDESTNPAL